MKRVDIHWDGGSYRHDPPALPIIPASPSPGEVSAALASPASVIVLPHGIGFGRLDRSTNSSDIKRALDGLEGLRQGVQDGRVTLLAATQMLDVGVDVRPQFLISGCYSHTTRVAYIQRVGRVVRYGPYHLDDRLDGRDLLPRADIARWGQAESDAMRAITSGTPRDRRERFTLETGSGKTTVAMIIMRAVPWPAVTAMAQAVSLAFLDRLIRIVRDAYQAKLALSLVRRSILFCLGSAERNRVCFMVMHRGEDDPDSLRDLRRRRPLAGSMAAA